MRLSQAAVYNTHKCDSTSQSSEKKSPPQCIGLIDSNIKVKNHFFDSPKRRRRKQRKSKPSDISIQGTMRGEKGVRENFRVAVSKIVPSVSIN